MPVNDFNARADAAMRGMKANMGLPSTPVPDGSSSQGQAPPPGSYAEMLLKQRQAQMAQETPSLGRNTVEMEEPVPQSDTGGVAPSSQPVHEGSPDVGEDGKSVPFEKHPIYGRFAEVSRERTQFKRQLEQLEQDRGKFSSENEALKQRLAQLETQHQQLMTQHMDNLPPEDRAALVARMEVEQGLQRVEQRMNERFQPLVRSLDEERKHRELEGLARRYPAFDFDKHLPLIETFREVNPICSMEHAFRAVAEDHELLSNGQPARRVPPPVVVPGGSTTSKMDAHPPQEKEEQNLVDGARAVGALSRSQNPEDRAQTMDAAAASIASRYRPGWDQRGIARRR